MSERAELEAGEDSLQVFWALVEAYGEEPWRAFTSIASDPDQELGIQAWSEKHAGSLPRMRPVCPECGGTNVFEHEDSRGRSRGWICESLAGDVCGHTFERAVIPEEQRTRWGQKIWRLYLESDETKPVSLEIARRFIQDRM